MKKLIRISLVLAATISAAIMMASAKGGLVWPQTTKPETPRYLGVQVCAACHAEIAEKQQKSLLAKAMKPSSDCQILSSHKELKFQSGKFTFEIKRQGNQSIYSVSDGTIQLSVPLLYCFGQGKSGQTYVYEYGNGKYESRVSFYTAIDGLDFTLGYAKDIPANLVEAAGRKLSVDEARNCFQCHTTGAAINHQLNLEKMVPGVNCEACHGPGEKHVAAMKAGEKAGAGMKKLGELDGDDMNQNLCGSCHRSAEEVFEMPNRAGINSVRFQPYRIFHSRCYSADRRIGCTSCHDPHGDLETSATFYDAKCLSCHQSKPEVAKTEKALAADRTARACPTGKNKCTDCHMPKIDLPGAHFKFTDHRIRIVREGAPYPN